MGRVLRRREAIGRAKRGAWGLPDSILVVTVALAVGAAAFQGLAHVANAALFDYSVQLIDADYDHSAFGWAGSAATIAGVPAALMLAAMNPPGAGSSMPSPRSCHSCRSTTRSSFTSASPSSIRPSGSGPRAAG